MPLITVGTGSVEPGTHVATLIGITPKRMATQFSNPPGKEDDFLEWTWLVDDGGEGTEVRSLTTTATGSRSRIFEYLVALLGKDGVKVGMGLEESDLVGKSVMLSIILNDEGFPKVDRVVAAPAGTPPRSQPTAAKEPVAAAVGAADDAPTDDLPF